MFGTLQLTCLHLLRLRKLCMVPLLNRYSPGQSAAQSFCHATLVLSAAAKADASISHPFALP